MIDPGQLKHRVSFERRTGGGSFEARAWELVKVVWGSVRASKPRETFAADTVVAMLTHTVLTRWSLALAVPVDNAHWRIRYTDRAGAVRVLAITGPGRDFHDGGHWLIFDCTEGATDGA